MEDCIFCKIVSGQIPSEKIWENDFAVAFLDIGPVSDGHTLIVSKKHYKNLSQCPPEYLSGMLAELNRIAKAVTDAVDLQGYNLLCNNGRVAGQLVDHLHFHIIPRKNGDKVLTGWPSYEYEPGQAEKIKERIIKNL
jgi:histidine triad (HIT) family protein